MIITCDCDCDSVDFRAPLEPMSQPSRLTAAILPSISRARILHLHSRSDSLILMTAARSSARGKQPGGFNGHPLQPRRLPIAQKRLLVDQHSRSALAQSTLISIIRLTIMIGFGLASEHKRREARLTSWICERRDATGESHVIIRWVGPALQAANQDGEFEEIFAFGENVRLALNWKSVGKCETLRLLGSQFRETSVMFETMHLEAGCQDSNSWLNRLTKQLAPCVGLCSLVAGSKNSGGKFFEWLFRHKNLAWIIIKLLQLDNEKFQ